jgi:pyruvate dehydrogenase E2 component (dihydrolipoamide acetyltransferase)
VVNGQVVPRQVLTLSLGADHRVTDGRLGAQFLARVAALLADPAAL